MFVSGKFVWKKIGDNFFPAIMRNENEYFVSTRMAQHSIQMYLRLFHKDVYRMCLNIDSYYTSESEATLLSFINEAHWNKSYDEDNFQEGKDYLVSLTDVQEMYVFFKTFYCRLTTLYPNYDTHYGFLVLSKCTVRIAGQMGIPFCVQDGEMYAPASFIDLHFGNIDQLTHTELTRWSASYLKMCYLIMRLDKEPMYQDDKFTGINVTELVRCLGAYPPFTFWIDSNHLIRDGPEIEPDVWFNKPGVRVMKPLDSASWGEVYNEWTQFCGFA